MAKQPKYDDASPETICGSAAWQAATMLVGIFVLYLVVGAPSSPALHGAVYDDDGGGRGPNRRRT